MTTNEIVALFFGSALVSGIVSATVNGIFNSWLKRAELRESRLAVAATLTRLNQERYIEAGRNTPGSEVALLDPARVLRFYIAELDSIAKNRTALKAEWTQDLSYKAGASNRNDS